jgi:hypothetical protein
MTARIERVLRCPAASNWLKGAVRDLLKRDPVDAANDVDYLAELMTERADVALMRAGEGVRRG